MAEWLALGLSGKGRSPVKENGAAAYYGGNYGNGANAGLFYLNVNNAASNSNTNIGGRLANDFRQKAPGLRVRVQCVSFGVAVLTM